MSRKGARIAHGSSCRACRRLEWTRDRTRKLVVLADTQKGRATLTDSLGTLLAKTKRRHAYVKINVVHTPSNPAHPKTPYPKPPHPNLPLKSTSIRQLHAAIVACLLHHPSQPKSVTFSIDFTRDLSPAVVHKVNQLLQFLLDACDVTISSRFSTFTPLPTSPTVGDGYLLCLISRLFRVK